MNVKSLAVILSVVLALSGVSKPIWAKAPTIDQLIANPKMLTAELDRCKHLGMAANDDARCHTAWRAQNKQFFGKDPTYTKRPVNIFRNTPAYTSPSLQKPNLQKPTQAGPPNG